MSYRLLALSLGVAVCLASAGSFAAGEKKDAEKPADKKLDRARLAALVRQLGSEAADEREAAANALEEIGGPALDSLRNAIAAGDGDIALRARILIKKIEKRVEADRVIAPTMVKLSFKKKLVTDAVAELAKKSGYRIAISGDNAEVKKRRVTYDTDGEVPFWKAFDQLCLKSGLVEWDGQVRPGVPRPMPMPMPPFPNPMNPAKPELPSQIYVEDGNPTELPTYYAGAVRIRPLPSDSLTVTSQRGVKETLVILEVTAEPKVQWQQLDSVKILKALDEQAQELEMVKPPELPKGPGGVVPMPPRPLPPIGMPRQPGMGGTAPSLVPIRFTLAAKPSRVLKELKGVLVAKIQTPMQPLITVTDVLEATEKKYKGESGGAIEILEIKAEKKGEVRVRLVLEVPSDVVEANPAPMPGVPVMPMPVVPGGPGAAPAAKDTFGCSLLDSRGRKFNAVNASSKQAVRNGTPVKEYTLTFAPQVGQGKAAKLVYEAARVATVDVPFTLADVPVP